MDDQLMIEALTDALWFMALVRDVALIMMLITWLLVMVLVIVAIRWIWKSTPNEY